MLVKLWLFFYFPFTSNNQLIFKYFFSTHPRYPRLNQTYNSLPCFPMWMVWDFLKHWFFGDVLGLMILGVWDQRLLPPSRSSSALTLSNSGLSKSTWKRDSTGSTWALCWRNEETGQKYEEFKGYVLSVIASWGQQMKTKHTYATKWMVVDTWYILIYDICCS